MGLLDRHRTASQGLAYHRLLRAAPSYERVFGMCAAFRCAFDMDYFLLAMPYTLLDQSALDGELDPCDARGVEIILGAVFASGILATGAGEGALYGYQPAEAPILEKVGRIESICAGHGISLVAAALQFPLGHPRVVSVIPGPGSPEQVRQNVAAMGERVPDELWAELKRESLLHPEAPVPGG